LSFVITTAPADQEEASTLASSYSNTVPGEATNCAARASLGGVIQPPRSPTKLAKQAEQARFDSDNGKKAALLSTLTRTRELLAEGRL